MFVNLGLPVSYQLFHKIKMNPVFLVHNSYKLGYIVLTFKNIKPVMNISKIYFYLNSCIREIVSFLVIMLYTSLRWMLHAIFKSESLITAVYVLTF